VCLHCWYRTHHCTLFLQAEDGIRDRTVTGVQPCPLPILTVGGRRAVRVRKRTRGHPYCRRTRTARLPPTVRRKLPRLALRTRTRSEERRVGGGRRGRARCAHCRAHRRR